MSTVTFAIGTGKVFVGGQWVLAYETSNPQNAIYGQVASYVGSNLVVTVVATAGSGTHADWTIVLASSPAAAGLQPPVGSGNIVGPGSSIAGHIATFADATGKVVQDSGLAAGTLASRNALQFGDAGTKAVGAASLADGAAPLPYVATQAADNLHLSNDGTNPATDIQITPGRVRDDADITNLQLAGTMLKRIDLAWAAGGSVGNRQGMLLSSSSWLASKTYHLWLLGAVGLSVTQRSRTSNVATLTIAGHPFGVGGTIRVIGVGSGYDGVAAITATTVNTVSYANTGANEGATAVSGASADGFDIGATQQDIQGYPGANLPTGFGYKQCLGSVLTDGSKNIIAFQHYGDEFWWVSPILDVNQGLNNSSVTQILHTPGGVKVQAILNAFSKSPNPNGGLYISPPDIANQPLTGAGAPLGSLYGNVAVTGQVTNEVDLMGQVRCWTDASGSVRVYGGNAITAMVATLGWRDPRRRLF